MKIPKEIIDKIVASINLVEYVTTRGLDGKKIGSGYKALCPFHDDKKTPSFSIPAGKNFFKCFGCEVGGDVISFIMRYDNVDFPKAVEIAAAYAGVEMPQEGFFSPEEIRSRMEREKLNVIYMAAADYCHQVMPPDVKEHLKVGYGFTDEFIYEKRIGFDDGNLFNFLHNELGYSYEDLMSTGLFLKFGNKVKDFMHTRIIFWYWKNGFPVYAIGRQTEYTRNLQDFKEYEQSKYKKLLAHNAETRTYISREVENKFIYNEEIFTNAFNRPEYGIITEGITDAMLAEQIGIPVMSPVTKQFRQSDLENLKRIAKHLPAVYIVNDNEENESGLQGALATARELSSAGINAYITTLPRPEGVSKVDLNDFLKTIPDEKTFRAFLSESSTSYLNFLIKEAMKHFEEGELVQSQQLINEAIIETRHMDPMTQEAFFKGLAKETGMRIGVIREQFKALLDKEKEDPKYKESEGYYQELLNRAKSEDESDGHKLYRLLLDKGAQFYRMGGMESTDVIMSFEGQMYYVGYEESPFTLFLQNTFNLNYLDYAVKKMIFEMKSKAYYGSIKMKKQTWFYCDKEKRTLYLPLGYEDTRIVRVSPSGIDIINNGEDNGIFINAPGQVIDPWEFDPMIDKKLVARDLVHRFTEYAPCKDSEALMFLITTMAYPFKRYVDTVPMVKIHGRTSSGKTQLAKAILNIFYGNERGMGEMTDASLFDQADKRMIIVLDNIEKIDRVLLELFLLFAASNGNREIRDKGKESGTISQAVDCFPILTAIHPFEKPELLNRSIDIITDAKYHKRDKDITLVNEDFRIDRPKFLSLWMYILKECLESLDKMREKRNIIAAVFPRHFKERLNAFYGVTWHVAEAFLRLAGWEEAEIQELVFDWIENQSQTGSEQEKDISQVYYYFSMIAQFIRDKVRKDWYEEVLDVADMQQGMIVIEATGAQLFTVFSRASKEVGQRPPFVNPRQLVARVQNDQNILEENGWTFESRVRRARGGAYLHRFTCPVIYVPQKPIEEMVAPSKVDWADDDGWD